MTPTESRSRAEIREEQALSEQRFPAHARFRRSHRVMRSLGLVLTGALAFVATGAGAVYYTMQGNITSVDVSALLGDAGEAQPDPVDPNAGTPLNILLLGSDDRSGVNADIGGVEDGMRSDTSILMHISADRSRVELISIPRDTLVDIPSCTMTDGTTTWAQSDAMFNSAFAIGWDNGGDITSAVGCTMKTVQEVTGVTLSGFALVDFAGFQSMIDSIGGVPMCIPEDIESPDAGLYLSAGYQTLNGAQALGLARARKGTNMDGSDLKRIDRQQELLGATASAVLDRNTLLDPSSLLPFLNAATSSVTASPELASIQNLSGLAFALRGIDKNNITFMTIPIMEAPSDRYRVVMTSEADAIWAKIASDTPIVEPVVPVEPTPDPAAPAPEAPDVVETPVEPTTPAPAPETPEGVTSAATVIAGC